jgi:hypothetical protein
VNHLKKEAKFCATADDNIDIRFVVDAVEYCCEEAVLDFTQAAIENPVYCTSVIDIDVDFFHVGTLQASPPLVLNCASAESDLMSGVAARRTPPADRFRSSPARRTKVGRVLSPFFLTNYDTS